MGACVLDTRPAQDECQSIVGRSLMSSAARRAPMVREVLRLMGSQATRLPTDVDRSLRLSTMLVSGGGTLGIEAGGSSRRDAPISGLFVAWLRWARPVFRRLDALLGTSFGDASIP